MTIAHAHVQEYIAGLDIKKLRADLGLSREKMGRLMNVSAKTVERWETDAALPGDTARRALLAKVDQLRTLGLQVYTRSGFVTFLATPLAAFGYRTALQEIEIGGIDRVVGELAADYEGLGY